MVEYAVLLLFTAFLFLCVMAGKSVVLALIAGYGLFFLYGLYRGCSPANLVRLSWIGVKTVRNILLTYTLVGVITALWRVSGTIPTIICYATGLIDPSIYLLIAFLLCALLSILTGTALGTVSTMGVICMAMGRSLGVDPVLLGGAILSGIRVGDRCSPMSTSALLVCEITQTDLYKNIKNMIRTSAVPLAAAMVIYGLLGRSQQALGTDSGVVELLQNNFQLEPVAVLPAVLVIVLALFRVRVKRTMAVSICAAFLIAWLVQGRTPLELGRIMVLGFHPDNSELAAVLSGGGVVSMLQVLIIVLITATYTEIFRTTGLLDRLQERLAALSRTITPYGALLVTAILTSAITCSQSLTIILTFQLCENLIPHRVRMAGALEDTAVIIPALIPWSVAGAVPLSAIAAPPSAMLAACYLYLLPLWHFVGQKFIRVQLIDDP